MAILQWIIFTEYKLLLRHQNNQILERSYLQPYLQDRSPELASASTSPGRQPFQSCLMARIAVRSCQTPPLWRKCTTLPPHPRSLGTTKCKRFKIGTIILCQLLPCQKPKDKNHPIWFPRHNIWYLQGLASTVYGVAICESSANCAHTGTVW